MNPFSCLLLTFLLLLGGSQGARLGLLKPSDKNHASKEIVFPRPPYEVHALMARWLVHETSWGILSTLDRNTGEPIGGVVSHSDGARNSPSGRIFFYITPMDELTKNIVEHPRCSFTISEQQRFSQGAALVGNQPCGGLDPEDPACARASLLGLLQPVAHEDQLEAQEAMFTRHPRIADWPVDHRFEFYELKVEEVHLLDWYGGMSIVSGKDYYSALDTTA